VLKIFPDNDIYCLSNDALLVILETNDVRNVNKIVGQVNSFFSDLTSKNFQDFSFDFKMCSLRYPVSTGEKKYLKILNYLNVTMDSLHSGSNYADFEYALYEQALFDTNYILQINKGINSYQHDLTLLPIIDLQHNSIHSYYCHFSIPALNVEHDNIIKVAKLKNKLLELETSYIHLVGDLVSTLAHEIKKMVKLVIEVSYSSLLNESFFTEFKASLVTGKSFGAYIDIAVIDFPKLSSIGNVLAKYQDLGFGLYCKKLDELFSSNFNGVFLDNVSVKDYNKALIHSFVKTLDTEGRLVIIRGVNDTKTLEELQKLGHKLVISSLYKSYSSKELINKILQQLSA
jgi:EAL domain-containing protein (putative c-di-GMP-specific phosphodiesterase class I)